MAPVFFLNSKNLNKNGQRSTRFSELILLRLEKVVIIFIFCCQYVVLWLLVFLCFCSFSLLPCGDTWFYLEPVVEPVNIMLLLFWSCWLLCDNFFTSKDKNWVLNKTSKNYSYRLILEIIALLVSNGENSDKFNEVPNDNQCFN